MSKPTRMPPTATLPEILSAVRARGAARGAVWKITPGSARIIALVQSGKSAPGMESDVDDTVPTTMSGKAFVAVEAQLYAAWIDGAADASK